MSEPMEVRSSGALRLRAALIASLASVALFLADDTASAAVGDLTYLGCISGHTGVGPGGTGACSLVPSAAFNGSDSGFDTPQSIAVSPDGRSLYAVAREDDSIIHFQRDPNTGSLTYVGCLTGEEESGPGGSNACAELPSAEPDGIDSGIDNPHAVVVSPNGTAVYVVALNDDALLHFSRDTTTGSLGFVGCLTGELESTTGSGGPCAGVDPISQGLDTGFDQLFNLDASPDGFNLYAVSQQDAAVLRFNLAAGTGAPSFAFCFTGETATAAGACDGVNDTVGGDNSGFNKVRSIVVASDGSSVHAASPADDSVLSFARGSSGNIDYLGCLTGEDATGPAGTGACAAMPSIRPFGDDSGIDNPQGVGMSADSNSLYVASGNDAGIAHFRRDPGSGGLSFAGCLSGDSDTGPDGTAACGLVGVPVVEGNTSGLWNMRSVRVSADGVTVYGTAGDDDAVVRFNRDLGGGSLSAFSCITGRVETGPVATGGSGACAAAPVLGAFGDDSGWDFLHALALSPDDRSLYAGAQGDDGILTFAREPLPAPAAPPTCKGKPATVFRQAGTLARTLTGTSKRDVIVGTKAKDTIRSKGGKDLVCARGGRDKVSTGGGKDKAFGEGGRDRLNGGAGRDNLNGGKGADRLLGRGGSDKLKGGKGRDRLLGGRGRDRLKGGKGPDTLIGGPGADKLAGGAGKDKQIP